MDYRFLEDNDERSVKQDSAESEFLAKVTVGATNPLRHIRSLLHSLVRSMHVLSVLLFLLFFFLFFFTIRKVQTPTRIPRIHISKTKQQTKRDRLQMRLKICFSSSQRIIDYGHGIMISSFSWPLPFLSNWIFRHDYKIKKKRKKCRHNNNSKYIYCYLLLTSKKES